MRLIDADELKKMFTYAEDAEYAKWTLSGVISEIDDMPTVDKTVTEFADRCRECGMMQGKRLKHMREEIEQIPDHTMVSERSIQVFTAERMKKEVLKIFDKY